jgi:hypothetical protein
MGLRSRLRLRRRGERLRDRDRRLDLRSLRLRDRDLLVLAIGKCDARVGGVTNSTVQAVSACKLSNEKA